MKAIMKVRQPISLYVYYFSLDLFEVKVLTVFVIETGFLSGQV